MIFSYILIYELVFHTTSGASHPGPPPTFKCRYRTACCNSVQKRTASVSFTAFTFFHFSSFSVIEVSNNDSERMWVSGSNARCFKSSAWFSRGHNFPYMCLRHFKALASRSIFENHRKPIFEIVIFTYCHNASHVFTLYICSLYVHYYITPSQFILMRFHFLRFTRLAILV